MEKAMKFQYSRDMMHIKRKYDKLESQKEAKEPGESSLFH